MPHGYPPSSSPRPRHVPAQILLAASPIWVCSVNPSAVWPWAKYGHRPLHTAY